MKFQRVLAIFSTLATATLAAKLRYTGVNESGAEFGAGKYPGVYNKDYIYPDITAIQTTMNQGMNIFRVGFSWERIQRTLNGEFDSTEFKRLDEVIKYITSKGSVAILNPHNFARYNGNIVGSGSVPNSAFVDLWKRFAQKYKSNSNVWFGLVNEPHDMPTEQWYSAARDAVDAIRAAGANSNILVPGNGWTGAWCWNKSGVYGTPNSEAALKYFSSADKNILFEVHQYFDTDYSGTHTQCVQRPCNNLFKGFVDWLKKNNLKGFVGELGAAVNNDCKACVEEAISYLEQNSSNVVGWTWWAAGPWWGDYMYSLEPKGNSFPEQMTWLKPHLSGASSSTDVPTYDPSVDDTPTCEGCKATATSSDGTLWGWENEASCKVDAVKCSGGSSSGGNNNNDNDDDNGNNNETPVCKGCEATATSSDGTLWGWENNTSCKVDAAKCTSGGNSGSSSSSGSGSTVGCANQWAQCGGNNFSGATCCSTGKCVRLNEWYSQCQ